MDLVHDHGLDRAQPFTGGRAEQQVERFGGGHQHVGRRLLLLASRARRRVAGANGHRRHAQGETQPFGGEPDAGERPSQVALHVVDQRLERRDVQHTHARAEALGQPAQPIEAPQEGGQRLAAARGRAHQGVPARRDERPAALLRRRWRREGLAKPGPRGWAEAVHVPMLRPGAGRGKTGRSPRSGAAAGRSDRVGSRSRSGSLRASKPQAHPRPRRPAGLGRLAPEELASSRACTEPSGSQGYWSVTESFTC